MTNFFRIISSNLIHNKACFYKKNLYEGSYVGPYEGSNAVLNEIPNDDLNKKCDIIALMIKKHVKVLALILFGKKVKIG